MSIKLVSLALLPFMKQLYYALIFSVMLIACNSETKQQVETEKIEQIVKMQPAGTTIAADSILYNKLNKFYFTVIVKTTESSGKGTYIVEARIGPSIALSKFTMPHGAEDAVPIMRRIEDSTSFIIGFYYGKDTTFYDYYQVKAANGNIEMKYTKAYRFD